MAWKFPEQARIAGFDPTSELLRLTVHLAQSDLAASSFMCLCTLSWHYHTAHCCDLQLLEEPVADPNNLTLLASTCRIPIGLDETIDALFAKRSASVQQQQQSVHSPQHRLRALVQGGAVGALVLKPGVLGGFEKCMGLAKLVHKWGVQVGSGLVAAL